MMTDRELMQQALETLGDLVEDTQHADHFCGDPHCPVATARTTITALRERLARQEQEPVAYMQGTGLYWPDDAAVDEPDCQPLYTAPQQREWRGLTEEERDALYDDCAKYQIEGQQLSGWNNFARAIEAALKEKNQ